VATEKARPLKKKILAPGVEKIIVERRKGEPTRKRKGPGAEERGDRQLEGGEKRGKRMTCGSRRGEVVHRYSSERVTSYTEGGKKPRKGKTDRSLKRSSELGKKKREKNSSKGRSEGNIR